MNMKKFALAATVLCAPFAAQAHATLEQAEAAAGSYYKAVLRIPHGCDGQATEQVAVEVPEGLIGAKPMPKAGWDLSTRSGAYQNSYTNHGRTVTEGVLEVVWSNGSLPNDWYDEFVFRGKIAGTIEPGTVLYFKTTQTCADGSVAWIDIPAEGQDRHDVDHPAPALTVTEGHHHHH